MSDEANESGKRPMMDITGESPDAKRPVVSESPDAKVTIDRLNRLDDTIDRFGDTIELPDDNAPNHVV